MFDIIDSNNWGGFNKLVQGSGKQMGDEGGGASEWPFNLSSVPDRRPPLQFEVFFSCAMLIGRRRSSNMIHLRVCSHRGIAEKFGYFHILSLLSLY